MSDDERDRYDAVFRLPDGGTVIEYMTEDGTLVFEGIPSPDPDEWAARDSNPDLPR